jgi:hypothetical protein
MINESLANLLKPENKQSLPNCRITRLLMESSIR